MSRKRSAPNEENPTSGLGNTMARQTFLCGQELYSYGDVWSGPFEWNFPSLLGVIRERLRSSPRASAYVFGCSEPQQFTVREGGSAADRSPVLPIPTMVVVLCDVAVPSTLGITSVQMNAEKIVPMRDLKMSWVPWNASCNILSSRRGGKKAAGGGSSGGEKQTSSLLNVSDDDAALDARIFTLNCTMRHSGRGHSEQRRKQYEYAMPYVLRSKDVADEPEEVMHVSCSYTSSNSGKVVEFGFDKEVDRTQTFIPELIEDYNLDETEFDAIKAALKAAFQAKRSDVADKLEAQRGALTANGEKAQKAIDNLVLLK